MLMSCTFFSRWPVGKYFQTAYGNKQINGRVTADVRSRPGRVMRIRVNRMHSSCERSVNIRGRRRHYKRYCASGRQRNKMSELRDPGRGSRRACRPRRDYVTTSGPNTFGTMCIYIYICICIFICIMWFAYIL